VPTLRLVAVKKISVFDDAKRHQMVRELRALHHNKVPLNSVEWGETPNMAGPSCDCMVSFYDAYTEMNEGSISLVMEYMDGGSLQDIVDTVRVKR
jgi:serine/threonine protein kinase